MRSRRPILALVLLALAPPALAAAPYEGQWASSPKACRDPDGVNRMEINPNGLFWYETRCRPGTGRQTGPNAWTFRAQCEGEGDRFPGRPRITLVSPDRLVMESSPVGREKRQSYVRCKDR